MPRETVKSLKHELEHRDQTILNLKEENRRQASDLNELVELACGDDLRGLRNYGVADALAAIRQARRRETELEGRENGAISVLNRELDRAWRLIRSLAGDKTLEKEAPLVPCGVCDACRHGAATQCHNQRRP